MNDSNESENAGQAEAVGEEISYEAFGRAFFERAVTRERIEAALANMTGDKVEFGPRQVGPAGIGLASIKASGELLEAKITREQSELVRFAVVIPVYLELSVRLAGHDHRFEGHIRARLSLTARARKPLHIYIDIPAPTKEDVEVEVEAQGLRASVLDIVADIDGELRRFIARYIADEIEKPEIRDICVIDIATRVDQDGAETVQAFD